MVLITESTLQVATTTPTYSENSSGCIYTVYFKNDSKLNVTIFNRESKKICSDNIFYKNENGYETFFVNYDNDFIIKTEIELIYVNPYEFSNKFEKNGNFDLDKFNRVYERNREPDPNDHGYDDELKNAIENYTEPDSETKEKMNNLHIKFNNEDFNKIFENDKTADDYNDVPDSLNSSDNSNNLEIFLNNGLIDFGKKQEANLDYSTENYTDVMKAFDNKKLLSGADCEEYINSKNTDLEKKLQDKIKQRENETPFIKDF